MWCMSSSRQGIALPITRCSYQAQDVCQDPALLIFDSSILTSIRLLHHIRLAYSSAAPDPDLSSHNPKGVKSIVIQVTIEFEVFICVYGYQKEADVLARGEFKLNFVVRTCNEAALTDVREAR